MKRTYLVIWQFGSNINTRTETPIDVEVSDDMSARVKFDGIISKLEQIKGIEFDSNICIISINIL